MAHWINLYQVTKESIERSPYCGCSMPVGMGLENGITNLCYYHQGMEDGIDIDRNQQIMKIVEAIYDEGLIDKTVRQILINELEENG